MTPDQAGKRLATLMDDYDLAIFEYWLSDYAGHHQDMSAAQSLLETFDRVLGGLLEAWDDKQGLILITSDHGNMEDLGTRRHTANPVPALLIGDPIFRQDFAADLTDIIGVTPSILKSLHQSI
jgi:bisphosphoglycerate-independent phosphoglycerate mutase (AlkP superfamily)